MADLPIKVLYAADANYAAGAHPWSGTPTKVAPGSSFQSKGWIPGSPIAAQEQNYVIDKIQDLAIDAQQRGAVKAIAQGTLDSYSLGWFLEGTKRLVSSVDVTGTQKITAFAANNPGRKASSATTMPSFQDRFAYDRVSKKLVCFSKPLVGSSGTFLDITDDKALTTASRNPPTVNARYTDVCTDVSTGKIVMVSALDPGTPAFGVAYGSPPSALSWTAAGIGWISDTETKISSKPGETRIFSYQKTYSTPDAGATLSSVNTTTWTGGYTAGSTMFRPCWDTLKSRWICSTAKMGVSHDDASSSSKLWTSTDGITWTTLATNPAYVFLDMVCFKGWLWAAGCVLDRTGNPGHGGIEIFYSRDGGTTWIRTGLILSLRTGGTVTDHQPRLVPCDGILMCLTYRATGAAGDLDYIAVDTGAL